MKLVSVLLWAGLFLLSAGAAYLFALLSRRAAASAYSFTPPSSWIRRPVPLRGRWARYFLSGLLALVSALLWAVAVGIVVVALSYIVAGAMGIWRFFPD
jgi:hypothetical protein